jgi:hypothetical protein
MRRRGMSRSIPHTLVLLAVCGVLLFGVAACGGGGAEVRSEVTTTTTGQQLIDLKKALDSGAMTQQEYEKERKKILSK